MSKAVRIIFANSEKTKVLNVSNVDALNITGLKQSINGSVVSVSLGQHLEAER